MAQHQGKIAAAVAAFALLLYVLAVYWSSEPESFNVVDVAKEQAAAKGEKLVVGYTTTTTLIKVTETLLDKPGGYLSNDVYFFA
ncbi:DUF2333 family protein [Pseudoalteromonas fenneropenaei]|uniref:DUF2333 family protein n=1 Tax=Pseudoalteromonas fenneropenaei TaxID=1737459 RepID=A0ABV7CLZ5_9GAMM